MMIAAQFGRRTAIALATVMLVGLLGVGLAEVDLTEDQPTIPAPTAGDVTGTITPAEQVQGVSLVSRQSGRAYQPSHFDPATGTFRFADLPGDAAYDLVIVGKGRIIEGVDLSFVDARLLRMAATRREQLGMAPEPGREFTQADADWLLKFIAEMKDFMDTRRVLYIQGHGRRATMLVELLRTREFHADGGDIIWRVELWYFEYQAGGWQRVANQDRVLHRFRGPVDDWRKIAHEFRPELSVFVDADGSSQPLTFTIPDKIDPSRGRPANTAPALTTQPHILGLDQPTSQPDADSSAG
ncbi:MAG TPA: hypothetical protein ENH80_14795 [Phycisphaerae bacterium]|nr:hypothetical protein [Phycisphaerae bacterium]HDZ45198.1 hypothetical protein [Phycisphaerae bacterium]